ncbi:MAG: hypothetical protein N2Z65_08435, partial [Clostridiales bacterium]|nr:hypothetical protein [Clostridiales bacterium]
SVKAQNNKKEKVQALSWHGLRYYFCQTQYAQLLNDKDAKRKLSEMLGHHRGSITDTYLNSKKTKKKK